MRPKIVAGNWKMNGNQAFVQDYMVSFKECWGDKKLDQFSGLSVIIVPSAILIASVKEDSEALGIGGLFELACQNVAEYSSGAYTGEISASMLKDFGCRWSLVGHSERRALFGDQSEVIIEKIKQLLAEGLRPILCLGETLEEREQGKAEVCVRSQLESVLNVFSVSDLSNLVLAYEPVWAIGTGKTASPEEAQAMHKFIRSVVASKSTDLSAVMIVLYGGSVNSSNAESLFGQDDIDGALVGGASLKPEEFVEICFQCGQSALA
jgi:triosephosphate isomerase